MGSHDGITLMDGCLVITFGINVLALIWRYTGGAIAGTPNFLVASGVGLIVIEIIVALLLCVFRYIHNPPIGFVWVMLSLLLSSFVVSIAIAGGDVARVSLDGDNTPLNVVGYDVCVIVTQVIFLSGLFVKGFNAGSHRNPPPWAHRAGPKRYQQQSDEDDIIYASASHVIGQGGSDTEA